MIDPGTVHGVVGDLRVLAHAHPSALARMLDAALPWTRPSVDQIAAAAGADG